MADKSNKLKARRPRGLEDRGPAEIAATREMVEKIRAVYERYGFDPVETPAIVAVKKKYMRDPPPAWTAIGVSRLIPGNGITEITMVATLPAAKR